MADDNKKKPQGMDTATRLKVMIDSTEKNAKASAKREETLLEAVKLGNNIEDLNSRGESKRAAALQSTMDAVLESLNKNDNANATAARFKELVSLNEQANNILDSQKNAIESDESVNRLTRLTEELAGQKELIELQTKASTDTKKSLRKLSMTTEAGDPLLDELKTSFMDSQKGLEDALATGDQQQIDLAEKQLEQATKAIQTEEERREALKKQDEANSLLNKVADGLEGGQEKVAKTAGFLAGIAGIATLFFSPETFGAIVRKAIDTVSAIVDTIDKFINGDMDGMRKTIDENFTEFAVILGSLGLMILPKVLRAIRFLRNTFIAFRTFMVSDFVANMMANLRAMMASVGGAFMKVFRGLTAVFQVFRVFMLTTFVPSMIAAFSGMMAAMVPIFAALSPILIPILAIAALFGAIYVGLTMLRDAMGFTSIFDVIMLGVAYLQDAFGHVVNAIGSIVNFIFGIVEGIASFIGFDVELPKVPKMSTDNAEKKKAELDLKAEKARIEEEQRLAREKEKENLTGSEIPDISAENALGQMDVQQQPVVVSNQQSSTTTQSSSVVSNITSGRPLRTSGLQLSFSR